MHTKVITEAEARFLGASDDFAISKAKRALIEDRPAFWSTHKYHDQICCNGVDLANEQGLPFALGTVGGRLAARRLTLAEAAERFLKKVYPANLEAAAQIEKFCRRFNLVRED